MSVAEIRDLLTQVRVWTAKGMEKQDILRDNLMNGYAGMISEPSKIIFRPNLSESKI